MGITSGIRGLDEITKGWLPRGRPTLIWGSAGSGKTLFAKTKALEAKIAALRAEFDAESEELYLMAEEERKRQAVLAEDRLEMAHLRKGQPSEVRRSGRRRRGKGE